MSVMVRWYGDRVLEVLHRQLGQAVRQAGVLLQTRARLLCNRPARRIRRTRRRTTKAGPKGSQYTEFLGSAPGQPPMVRTSFGRRNILMEYNEGTKIARVGPAKAADYMAYLELGTQHIKSRPWLRRAMDESRSAIQVLIQTALHRAVGD